MKRKLSNTIPFDIDSNKTDAIKEALSKLSLKTSNYLF